MSKAMNNIPMALKGEIGITLPFLPGVSRLSKAKTITLLH
jgi:hypothetical protein